MTHGLFQLGRDLNMAHNDKSLVNKRRWTLLPWTALEEVVRAFEDGVKPGKYQVDDWQNGDLKDLRTVYVDAAFRHLTKWMRGERCAEDSGVNHLAHAAACMLILLWHDGHGKKAE